MIFHLISFSDNNSSKRDFRFRITVDVSTKSDFSSRFWEFIIHFVVDLDQSCCIIYQVKVGTTTTSKRQQKRSSGKTINVNFKSQYFSGFRFQVKKKNKYSRSHTKVVLMMMGLMELLLIYFPNITRRVVFHNHLLSFRMKNIIKSSSYVRVFECLCVCVCWKIMYHKSCDSKKAQIEAQDIFYHSRYFCFGLWFRQMKRWCGSASRL